MSIKYVIAIDPSINNVGCAVFEKSSKKLLDKIIIHPSKFVKNATYLQKARDICSQIVKIMNSVSSLKFPYNDIQLITEIPQHFGIGGYMSRESGAMLKLTFIAGMIFNITDNVISYEPNQWKGQLPKDVVARRLQKLYPKEKIFDLKTKKFIIDHNIADAIGIGHKHLYGKIE
jgi:hypothetical protein